MSAVVIAKKVKPIFQRFRKKSTEGNQGTPKQEEKYLPDELALKKMGRKEASPLNDPVWKASLFVVASSFLLGLLRLLIGSALPFLSWFLALIALVTW